MRFETTLGYPTHVQPSYMMATNRTENQVWNRTGQTEPAGRTELAEPDQPAVRTEPAEPNRMATQSKIAAQVGPRRLQESPLAVVERRRNYSSYSGVTRGQGVPGGSPGASGVTGALGGYQGGPADRGGFSPTV